MGISEDFSSAFLKAQLATGLGVPASGNIFVSVRDADKPALCELALQLSHLGFTITATAGTTEMLAQHGVTAERVNKVVEGRPHCVDRIRNGDFVMVINTTEGANAIRDSKSLRRQTLQSGVPYFTTIAAATAAVGAIERNAQSKLGVRALQDYHEDTASRNPSVPAPAPR